MSWLVHFRGGPLGGEQRNWSELIPVVRVPVFQPYNIAAYTMEPHDELPSLSAEFEEEVYNCWRRDYEAMTAIYVWHNPVPQLRKDLALARAQLAEIDRVLERG